MTLSSPRLELGISRVSGGRINQLSHEDASSFRSLAESCLHVVLTQSRSHVHPLFEWPLRKNSVN
jgi:hypothetical protein